MYYNIMCMVMMYLSNSGPSSFNALTGKVATLYVKAVWQLAIFLWQQSSK